jgi:hypothetical protein
MKKKQQMVHIPPSYSHSTQFNVVQFQICMVNPSIFGGSMVQPPKFEPWRFLSGPGFRGSGVPRTFIHRWDLSSDKGVPHENYSWFINHYKHHLPETIVMEVICPDIADIGPPEIR